MRNRIFEPNQGGVGMPGECPDLTTFIRLVQEVTGLHQLDPDDDFFEAGGDSLHAAHLVVLLDERWHLSVDIMEIVAAGSLRQMHQEVQAAQAPSSAPAF